MHLTNSLFVFIPCSPFASLKMPANHFGDIGYYDGKIYTGVEWFEDGRGQDIQIVLYDAETLNATQEFPWKSESGQVECSALTVDTDNGEFLDLLTAPI